MRLVYIDITNDQDDTVQEIPLAVTSEHDEVTHTKCDLMNKVILSLKEADFLKEGFEFAVLTKNIEIL